ncbi:MAG: hypothetical protein J6W10_00425 [Kiritimatiellae bacterium]|nr:hypothetical protein [Kiritimatiellia bacterium]
MDSQEYKQDVDALAQEMAEYRIENGGWTYSKEIRDAYLGHFAKWFDEAASRFRNVHDAANRIICEVQAEENRKVFSHYVYKRQEEDKKEAERAKNERRVL